MPRTRKLTNDRTRRAPRVRDLPDRAEAVEVPLTESFWHGSPELRSPGIKDFFVRNDLIGWPKKAFSLIMAMFRLPFARLPGR